MKNAIQELTGRSIGVKGTDWVYLDDPTHPKVTKKILNQAEALVFERLKAAKLVEIDQARDEALLQGFECDGVVYDSDQKSIQRISAIATLAIMNPEFSTPYITKANTTVELNAQDIAALGLAAAEHESTHVFLARSLKDQVIAATTEQELENITWPSQDT